MLISINTFGYIPKNHDSFTFTFKSSKVVKFRIHVLNLNFKVNINNKFDINFLKREKYI